MTNVETKPSRKWHFYNYKIPSTLPSLTRLCFTIQFSKPGISNKTLSGWRTPVSVRTDLIFCFDEVFEFYEFFQKSPLFARSAATKKPPNSRINSSSAGFTATYAVVISRWVRSNNSNKCRSGRPTPKSSRLIEF